MNYSILMAFLTGSVYVGFNFLAKQSAVLPGHNLIFNKTLGHLRHPNLGVFNTSHL